MTVSVREKAPVMILVRPQMGENIGALARAMKNFGLSEMRIVAPRDGWPNPKAMEMAVAAADILERAQIFDSLPEAVADLHRVYASTAQKREMMKDILPVREGMEHAGRDIASGQRVGILFGPERSGLWNEDVALADAILTIPTSPDFSSLNIAQAAVVIAYEWWMASEARLPFEITEEIPATRAQIEGFLNHLNIELEEGGYFPVPEKRPSMQRNLANLFLKARLTSQEVQSLRGVIRALAGRRPAK
jgi:tRNA/rRNA methyltransferase